MPVLPVFLEFRQTIRALNDLWELLKHLVFQISGKIRQSKSKAVCQSNYAPDKSDAPQIGGRTPPRNVQVYPAFSQCLLSANADSSCAGNGFEKA